MSQTARIAKAQRRFETMALGTHPITSALSPFELVDYLQLASLGRRSVVIMIEAIGIGRGSVEIVAGEVWNASVGPLTGVSALRFLLSEQDPVVALKPLCEEPATREITKPLTGLLLDLARERDETQKDRAPASALSFSRPQNTPQPWSTTGTQVKEKVALRS